MTRRTSLRSQLGTEPWRTEFVTLLLLLVVFASIWIFIVVAEEVREGDSRAIDRGIILALRDSNNPAVPLGPGWVQEMVRDLSALGGIAVLSLFTLGAWGFLWMAGKPRSAWFLLGAIGGGLLLSVAMKHGFERPRPDLVPHGSIVGSSSFPSGHSMLSAVTYLTMGALLSRVQARRRLKIYLLTAAATLSILVGFSRVYLGVHWPTDVLAGWAAGAAWAALCWVGVRFLQRRGQVEEEAKPPADRPPATRGSRAA